MITILRLGWGGRRMPISSEEAMNDYYINSRLGGRRIPISSEEAMNDYYIKIR